METGPRPCCPARRGAWPFTTGLFALVAALPASVCADAKLGGRKWAAGPGAVGLTMRGP